MHKLERLGKYGTERLRDKSNKPFDMIIYLGSQATKKSYEVSLLSSDTNTLDSKTVGISNIIRINHIMNYNHFVLIDLRPLNK